MPTQRRAGHGTGHSPDGNASANSRAALAKLAHPQLPPVYPRTRLFTWLDEAARRAPIIWIEGPPGAGKTTLVASWLAARRRPALWYRVDAGDRDVAAFFHYLGLAVLRAAPRYRTPLPKLTPEYLTGLPIFARNFFRELGRRLRPPFVLVLDNLHEVAADAGLYEVLREGLDELPPGTGAVLVSREEPPPVFARWQLEQRLRLLDWDALRLHERESLEFARFVSEDLPQTPASEDVQRLHEQCDGWLAGMLLLLRVRGSAAGADPPLSGMPAQRLFDYFAGEVFDRRHPAVKEFLIQTALLPSFTPPMAQKLTGNRQARRLLDDLVRQHHFTERRGTTPIYQYHPLFRAFLEEQAQASWSAAELQRLRHNAAAILERAGNHEEALELYMKSGDWDGAVRLILAQAQGFVATGRLETLRDSIARLPDAVLEDEPWLLYWRGICRAPFALPEARADIERAYVIFDRRDDAAGLYLSWSAIIESFFIEWTDFHRADKWITTLQALRARHPRFPSAAVEASVVTAAISMQAYRYLNTPDLAGWAERGETLLRAAEDDVLRGRLAAALFMHYIWLGRPEKIEGVVRQLRGLLSRETAGPMVTMQSCFLLAIYEWNDGDPRAALDFVERARELQDRHSIFALKHQVISQGAYAALVLGDAVCANGYVELLASATREGIEASHYHYLLAVTALHRNLPGATEHVAEALRLTEQFGMAFGYLCNRYLSANVAFGYGQTEQAKHHLALALRFAEERQSTVMVSHCRLTEAAIVLEEGRHEEGLAILREALAMSRALRGPAIPWLPHRVLARLYAAALDHGIEVEHVKGLIRRFGVAAPEGPGNLSAWPFPLKIHTLGRFRVLINDRALTFATKAQKKPLELLKALIALGGTRVDEEKLAEALWPDAEADAALHALGSTLYRLRKLIGEGTVVRQEGHLSLDGRQTWIDLWAVEHLVARLEQACAAHRPDEVAFLVDKTFKLYAGPFLESEPDAAWALSARERLRARLLRHLEAGARCLVVHAQHEQAIECYQRALEIEPLAEILHRGLMQSYVASGRRAEAVTAYEHCRRLLRQELGVDASPETDALAQSIKTS